MSSEEQKTPAQRIAELRAKQAEREAARQAEFESKELELLELVDKYEEQLGAQGREFEVIDARELGEGIIVVKRPEPAQHKRFMTAVDKATTKEKPVDEAEIAQYVAPNVLHPSREAYLEITGRRPEIGGRCSVACMALAGARKKDAAGKY